MVKYENGKVYKIEPIVEHPEEDIYIGSTTKQYLSQRMETHRHDYKYWKEGNEKYVSSYGLFDKYGIENCRIYLLETVEAKTKDELTASEGHYIRTLKCVNKQTPNRTKKEYYKDNRVEIKQKNQQYRENNKDYIKLYKKKYWEENKEKIKSYQKQYREKMKLINENKLIKLI